MGAEPSHEWMVCMSSRLTSRSSRVSEAREAERAVARSEAAIKEFDFLQRRVHLDEQVDGGEIVRHHPEISEP